MRYELRSDVAAPYSEAIDSRDADRAVFVAAAAVKDVTSERAEEYREAYALSVAMSERTDEAALRISETSWAQTEAAAAKKKTGVKRMLIVLRFMELVLK